MPVIYLETFVKAAPAIVFDLSRSVDLHKSSMLHYKEEIIDGVKKGLMNKGDSVTWRATHFFTSRTLKVHITEIKAPHFFCDEMIQGDFKQMKHEHYFETANNGTQMIDKFHFESPFGIFGKLVNTLFLESYMCRLLKERNEEIRRAAESNRWKQFINS